jgi:hypothetical protein
LLEVPEKRSKIGRASDCFVRAYNFKGEEGETIALSKPCTKAYKMEEEEGPEETSPLRTLGRKKAKALPFLNSKKGK